jgi:RHS repeat-associated protein
MPRLERPTIPVSYLTNGNIDEKFDAGEYAYDNSNHAVTDITGTGSAIPTNTQSITYNSFNKPTSVSQGYRNSQFKYSPDMQRCVMKTYNTQVFPAVWIDTRYYLGNYEELVVKGLKSSKKYHYIYSPDGLAAIYYTYGTTTAMYYAAKDHLGSICMLIDQNRSVVDERSFDAWGRNRNPVNWTYSSVPAMLITNRGYTTHEHLTDYGIVNMNGRLYDPIVGRMMNADPFIADYTSSQNYNRYSYVNNNPMKYTDPSGYIVWPWKKWKNVPMFVSDDSWLKQQREPWLSRAGGDGNNADDGYRVREYRDELRGPTGAISGIPGGETCIKPHFNFGPDDPPLKGVQLKQSSGFSLSNNSKTFRNSNTPNYKNNNYSWVDFGLNSVGLMSHTILTRQLSDMALPALGSRYLNGLKTASTTLKIVGTTTSVISGFISINRYIKNPNPTWGDNAQLAVGVTSSVLSGIPQTTYLGISIGMLDTFGGFNSWYSDWNQAQQTWNYGGFAFIPIINPLTGTYQFIAK